MFANWEGRLKFPKLDGCLGTVCRGLNLTAAVSAWYSWSVAVYRG